MSLIWAKTCKCDLCGHRWLLKMDGRVPYQCSKCKKTEWNTGGDYTVETSEPTSKPQPPAKQTTGSPSSSLAAVMDRYALKTGSELSAEVEVPAVTRRAFNPSRKGWYDLVSSADWGAQVVVDKDTAQVFLVVRGKAEEFETVKEAAEKMDLMGGAA